MTVCFNKCSFFFSLKLSILYGSLIIQKSMNPCRFYQWSIIYLSIRCCWIFYEIVHYTRGWIAPGSFTFTKPTQPSRIVYNFVHGTHRYRVSHNTWSVDLEKYLQNRKRFLNVFYYRWKVQHGHCYTELCSKSYFHHLPSSSLQSYDN